jgi:hypothetical protein
MNHYVTTLLRIYPVLKLLGVTLATLKPRLLMRVTARIHFPIHLNEMHMESFSLAFNR